MEIWFKPLAGANWAVGFLNRKETAQNIKFNWKTEAVVDTIFNKTLNALHTNYTMQNLWTGKIVGNAADMLIAEVPAHDILLLQLSATEK